MPSSRPDIVLAHGSYHTPAPYADLRAHLEKAGFATHCPQLPTADPKYLVPDSSNPSFDQAPPPGGHPQQTVDAEVLGKLLKRLIDEESKEVLLLAHSSGGWTACEAATPELQREKRREVEKKGGVIGIFYMASFLIMPGESVWSTFSKSTDKPAEAKEPAEWFTFLPTASLTIVNKPLHYFFHDIPAEEGEKWAKGLTACPFLTSPITNDAYSAVPCAYMLCGGDRVLPPWYQKLMIKSAEKTSGKQIEVYKCAGGHESFLSYPDVYVDGIANFTEKWA